MGSTGSRGAAFWTPKIAASFTVLEYPLKNSAILDSGTTIHIFNQKSRFITFRAAPEGDFVWAGEKKVPIQGYGTVDIAVSSPKGNHVLRLFDVAYCANFACNLVSLRRLSRKGYWWDTRAAYNCLRQADNSIICSLTDREDQYVIEYVPKEVAPHSFFVRRNRFNS